MSGSGRARRVYVLMSHQFNLIYQFVYQLQELILMSCMFIWNIIIFHLPGRNRVLCIVNLTCVSWSTHEVATSWHSMGTRSWPFRSHICFVCQVLISPHSPTKLHGSETQVFQLRIQLPSLGLIQAVYNQVESLLAQLFGNCIRERLDATFEVLLYIFQVCTYDM